MEQKQPIRLFRDKAGMTQDQPAEAVGISLESGQLHSNLFPRKDVRK